MESIGLKVVAVVSDIGSNFHQCINELGITPTRPWFIHNGRKIFYLYDAPHIIKAIRNNLIDYNFYFGEGKIASWSDIETMFKKHSKQSICLRPKLTTKHLHPNGFQKMKVKLATQVLSHTVPAVVSTYLSLGQLPSSACGKAELISKLDKTFDCLSSSSIKSPKVCRRANHIRFPHLKFLHKMFKLIPKIKSHPQRNEERCYCYFEMPECLAGYHQCYNRVMA